MFNSEKIYNVFEKPEAPEPTDRVELLREGFTFWAFVLGPIWLLAKRQWLLFFGFVTCAVLARITAGLFGLPMVTVAVAALFLHLMLGYHVNDLRAWRLKRRGYRFAGVLAAESPMHAQRRYYEFAA
jgi:hypothetical protein